MKNGKHHFTLKWRINFMVFPFFFCCFFLSRYHNNITDHLVSSSHGIFIVEFFFIDERSMYMCYMRGWQELKLLVVYSLITSITMIIRLPYDYLAIYTETKRECTSQTFVSVWSSCNYILYTITEMKLSKACVYNPSKWIKLLKRDYKFCWTGQMKEGI